MGFGVYATADTGTGVSGLGPEGMKGVSSDVGTYGVLGTYGSGVYGYAGGNSVGVDGEVTATDGTPLGVHGRAPINGYAGFFDGRVFPTKGYGGSSLETAIDDPRAPTERTLVHSAVTAPQLTNMYSGNATTDAKGFATVSLPDYFSSVNSDLRYRLTPVGQFAQAIVASEVVGNSVAIRTDKPNVKVSWVVIGTRSDPWAKAHPLEDVVSKPAAERGAYLNPEAYGQPESKGILFATHPELLDRNPAAELKQDAATRAVFAARGARDGGAEGERAERPRPRRRATLSRS